MLTRQTARTRIARALLHLAARRHAREELHLRRAASRAEALTRLAEDPRFWRVAAPEQRALLLARLNADRQLLGMEPLEELDDPRFAALAALFHRHCLEVQGGVPVGADGAPDLEPYLAEAATLFGEEFLTEQNVALHNRMVIEESRSRRVEESRTARADSQGSSPGNPTPAVPLVPSPQSLVPAVLPWRANYRRLLRPYAVLAPTADDRRACFAASLHTWWELRRDPEARPELVARFAASLLQESQALGLGWTADSLEAYARQEPPPSAEARHARTQRTLAYLDRTRAHLALLLDPHTPPAARRHGGAHLLSVLFDLDEPTAETIAALPPALQLRTLRRQGLLASAEVQSKGAWERMVFDRLLPRRHPGLTDEARTTYLQATRELARGTWRYFH